MAKHNGDVSRRELRFDRFGSFALYLQSYRVGELPELLLKRLGVNPGPPLSVLSKSNRIKASHGMGRGG